MTEPEPQPEPAQPSEMVPAAPAPPPGSPPPPKSQPGALPWLCGIGFVVLAAAIGFVWQSRPPAGASSTEFAALRQQVGSLQARVAALEQRPAAPPPAAPGAPAANAPDLAPLAARVDALDKRTADMPQLAALLNALSKRIDALPQPGATGNGAGTSELARRLDADEARLAALEKQASPEGQLAAQVAALTGRVEGLSSQNVEASLTRRLDADETRLATAEHNATQGSATADRAARLARIAAAQGALQAGRPLGDIPDAPPAVTRFATIAPPTEAALRQSFAAAAKAALAAKPAVKPDQPFLSRALSQAEQLVTVRRGDQVLLGDPAAGIVARAQDALDIGDLPGAVNAVAGLSGPQAAAMAPWLAQARALLDARNALADMAARG